MARPGDDGERGVGQVGGVPAAERRRRHLVDLAVPEPDRAPDAGEVHRQGPRLGLDVGGHARQAVAYGLDQPRGHHLGAARHRGQLEGVGRRALGRLVLGGQRLVAGVGRQHRGHLVAQLAGGHDVGQLDHPEPRLARGAHVGIVVGLAGNEPGHDPERRHPPGQRADGRTGAVGRRG